MHSLTEKIKGHYGDMNIDFIIRQWLEEKLTKLLSVRYPAQYTEAGMREILGLSQGEEPETYKKTEQKFECGCLRILGPEGIYGKNCPEHQPEKQGKEKCPVDYPGCNREHDVNMLHDSKPKGEELHAKGCISGKHTGGCCTVEMIGPEKPKETWCEMTASEIQRHREARCTSCLGTFEDNWKVCPYDGTPRPKPKTLEEKILESFLANDRHGDCQCNNKELHARELAKIAEEHFKELENE